MNKPPVITSHGHVRPDPSKPVARCGGPALCKSCLLEAAEVLGADVADARYPGAFAKNGLTVGYVPMDATGTMYRSFRDGLPSWTDCRDTAVFYARRSDAEAAHSDDEDMWYIRAFAIAKDTV